MSYRIINGQMLSIGNIATDSNQLQNKINALKNQDTEVKHKSFSSVLKETEKKNDQSFKISKHAAERLNEINFSKDDMKAIEKGFEIAQNKNSKNTVMLYKDVALIASVENKTLITAVNKNRTNENIFTNIDSVVLL